MRRQSFAVEVVPMDVLGAAEAILGEADRAQVLISTPDGDELDFATMMCATEYLMYITANRSGASYQRALHLLMEGTRKWVDSQTD